MQNVWNVIQRTLVTGASVSVMALVASQYVGQKPVDSVQENLPEQKTGMENLPSPITEPDHNIVVVDVPIPEGRFRGVTQSVNVRGGRVVGLQVTFEKMD